MKRLIVFMVCAFWAQTSFLQYWSKTYFKNSVGGSTFLQIVPTLTNKIIGNTNEICSDNNSCVSTIYLNFLGDSIKLQERLGFLGFKSSMTIRNDTIFYSEFGIEKNTEFVFWLFGMQDINGNQIAEYRFPLLHYSHTITGINIGITNYGLTLVKNDEVILWGEGLDKRMPNPNNVPYRSAFLRIGLDGTQKSDLIWYEYNDFRERRMSDATVDADGNLVFVYETRLPLESLMYRFIIKLNDDNSFNIKARASISDLNIDLPKIAIDKNGNYIIQTSVRGVKPEFNTSEEFPYITKFNRLGEEVWRKVVPSIFTKWFEFIFASSFKLNRISVCSNNDILCAGTCFLSDSFYIKSTDALKRISGNVSFIARFDTDGNLKWRHFLAPQKWDGSLYQNYVYDIQEAPDGSILVGGQLERDDDIPGFMGDAWLMRLSPDGCLNRECDHISKYWHFPDTIVSTDDLGISHLLIYPNPGSDYLHISVSEDMLLPLRYELSTVSGQRIMTGYHGTSDLLRVETHQLTPGMYIFRLMDKSGKVWQGKWVKGQW